MSLSACQLFSLLALQLAHLGACELVYNDSFPKNHSEYSEYLLTIIQIIQNIASIIIFPGQNDKSDESKFEDGNDGYF